MFHRTPPWHRVARRQRRLRHRLRSPASRRPCSQPIDAGRWHSAVNSSEHRTTWCPGTTVSRDPREEATDEGNPGPEGLPWLRGETRTPNKRMNSPFRRRSLTCGNAQEHPLTGSYVLSSVLDALHWLSTRRVLGHSNHPRHEVRMSPRDCTVTLRRRRRGTTGHPVTAR